MSRPNFDRLVPPPRKVPLGLPVNALFVGGGGFPVFAWAMLLFTAPGIGAEVQVEYVPSWPRFSRIVSLRRTGFATGAMAAILLPAFAAVLVVLSLSPGHRMLRPPAVNHLR